MAYVPVPKDMNAVKTKVLFNLTKRQLICFGSGAAVGVPLFFLIKAHAASSAAALCMIVVMLPFFLFAMYEKKRSAAGKGRRKYPSGSAFLRPKERPYRPTTSTPCS